LNFSRKDLKIDISMKTPLQTLILVILFASGVELLHAQMQPEWVMEVNISGQFMMGPIGHSFITSDGNFSGGIKTDIVVTSSGYTFSIYSSDGIFSGRINGSSNGRTDCLDTRGVQIPSCTAQNGSSSGSLNINIQANNESCVPSPTTSFDNSGFRLNIRYTIYRKLAAPTLPAMVGCTDASVQFSTTSVASSYKWEITDDPSKKDHWKIIPGKHTNPVTVSLTEINQPVFTTNLRYIRVADAICPVRVSYISPQAMNVYAPAPSSARVVWTDPLCHGGDDGSVTVAQVTGNFVTYDFTLKFRDPVDNQYKIICKKEELSSATFTKADIEDFGGPSAIKKGSLELVVSNPMSSATERGTCALVMVHEIGEPPELIVDAQQLSDFNGFAIKCSGESNGSVNATVSGGTYGATGYIYSWSNGAKRALLTGLSAGKYVVTAEDANRCVKKDSLQLTAPDPVALSIAETRSLQCAESANGILTAKATGGVPNSIYEFTWSTGEMGPVARYLKKGDYGIVVKDNNGCEASMTRFLDAPPPLQAEAISTSLHRAFYNVSCAGSSDGTATVNVLQFGSPPYRYEWTSGTTAKDAFNLSAGSYTVYITDSKSCTGSANVTLIEPPSVKVWVNATKPISCHGTTDGSLIADVTDAVLPVAYAWSTQSSANGITDLAPGHYSIEVTDSKGCIGTGEYDLVAPDKVEPTIEILSNFNGQPISCSGEEDAVLGVTSEGGIGLFNYEWSTGATSTFISKIGAGRYQVKVTDENGCFGESAVTLHDPMPLQVTPIPSYYSGYGISCSGGSDGAITLDVTGGTGLYNYMWSNRKTTPENTLLVSGDYSVTVFDSNGCKASAFQTLTEPRPLHVKITSQQNISCFNGDDGFIKLKSSGGVAAYEFSTDSGVSWQTTPSFDHLKAGVYDVHVKDKNGCKSKAISTLTEPEKIDISFDDVLPSLCTRAQGSVASIATGGSGRYVYEWKDSHGEVVSKVSELRNVKGGIYTLYVTDSNKCIVSKAAPITSSDGAKATWKATDTQCFDGDNGSAIITIEQGQAPFKVVWPGGQNTLHVQNMRRGIYYVAITDANDCTIVEEINISSPPAIKLQKSSVKMPTCFGTCDGELALFANGGVGAYMYHWNNKNIPAQKNLCAGIYAVRVTDSNGCTLNQNIILDEPDSLIVNVKNLTLPTCRNKCDAVLEVDVSGGNGDYQYSWETGEHASVLHDLCPQGYVVEVTDGNGCRGKNNVVVQNALPLLVDLDNGATICTGQTYVLDAGNHWSEVEWRNQSGFSSSEAKITIKEPGRYDLSVVDQKGCKGTGSFLLQNSLDFLQASFMITETASVADTVAIIDVSWPRPESIAWTYPNEMTKIRDNGEVLFGQFITSGSYKVSMTARLGDCVHQITKAITILDVTSEHAGGRIWYDDYLKNFSLSPNQNDGYFLIAVELREAGPIALSVWSSDKGTVLMQFTDDGKKMYERHVDLRPISSGVYVLRLDHNEGTQYLRFIVN
jgi:hypothetical protein